MSRIEQELEKVKVCLGSRFTPSYNTIYKKPLPDSIVQLESLPKIDSYIPKPEVLTHEADLYKVLTSLLENQEYQTTCIRLAQQNNKESKEYAKGIFAFKDFRYSKNESYLDENQCVRTHTTNESFRQWTGFQGFDIDFPKELGHLRKTEALQLKPIVFDRLKEFPWFILTTLSTGGHGIHIYTATQIPEDLTLEQRIFYFNNCYQKKALEIYKVLHDVYVKEDVYSDDEIIESLLDDAMYKPEQPMFITPLDTTPLVNEDFVFEQDKECLELSRNALLFTRSDEKTGKSWPLKEEGYEQLIEAFQSKKAFVGSQQYNQEYDYQRESIIEIKTESKGYFQKKEEGEDMHFYFGHTQRHDGVPTLFEIAKYLIHSRGVAAALTFAQQGIYKSPDNTSQEASNAHFIKIIKWVDSHCSNLRTKRDVMKWCNENLGFNDSIEYTPKPLASYNIYNKMKKEVAKDGKVKVLNIQDKYDTYFKEHALYKDKLKFNAFTVELEYDKNPLDDFTLARIYNGLSRDVGLKDTKVARSTIIEQCIKNSYNPLKDKLLSLKWNGQDMIGLMLDKFMKVNPSKRKLYYEFLMKWAVGMVKRVLHPGCKFDLVLVIIGPKGFGKSELSSRLGMGYTVDFTMQSDKDAIQLMQKAWIYNIDELAYMKKASFEAFKNFITRTTDNARFAYKEFNGEYPRKGGFIASSNDNSIITDVSDIRGERRLLIIKMDQDDPEYVYKNLTQEVVEQFWAQVMHIYNENPNLELYVSSEEFYEDQTQYIATSNDSASAWIEDILNSDYLVNENGEISSLSAMKEQYTLGRNNPNLSVMGTKIDKIPTKWLAAILKDTHREDSRSIGAIAMALKDTWYRKSIVYNKIQQQCFVRKKNIIDEYEENISDLHNF